MENNVTLVSSPDSFVGGDFRILLAGVSDAWMFDIITYYSTQDQHTVIHSITDENYDWIFSTAHTCDVIIIDINNYNSLGAGWLLRDHKTVFYGNTNIESLEHKKIPDPLSYIITKNKEIF